MKIRKCKCGADISHRGNNVKLCKKCQKIKRMEDNANSKRKERLEVWIKPEMREFLAKCFRKTEDELINLQAKNTGDYLRLAILVQQKKFHPKPSKYDLMRYCTEEFEHEVMGYFKNRDYNIAKNEDLDDKSWEKTGCTSEKPREDSLDVKLDKAKGGWVKFYNTDELVTTNPDLFFAKPQEKIRPVRSRREIYYDWKKGYRNKRKRQ